MKPRRPLRPAESRKRGRPPASPPRPRRSRRATFGIGVIAAALLAASAIVWLPRTRIGQHPAPPPPDPYAGLHPQQVYDMAVRLQRERRFTESLPLFRAALKRLQTDFMEIHRDYAAALYSASFELRPGPQGQPWARSSLERVQMVQEALRQMERAQGFDLTPEQRATLRNSTGVFMFAWGFPWETLIQYQGAYEAEPEGRDRAGRVLALRNLMQHPNRYALNRVPIQP